MRSNAVYRPSVPPHATAPIQKRRMTSDSPDVPGFEIVVWHRSGHETGGDDFDRGALEDGLYAPCVADVTGHGLGPARINSFCRAYGRMALRVDSRVAASLKRLNAELVGDRGDRPFVMFSAVVIALNEDRVFSTSAGHGPLPVCRRADACVASFGSDVLPLGVYGFDEEAQAVSHQLGPGDVFLVLADRVLDWANPQGNQPGTPRLQESLGRRKGDGGQSMIGGLGAEVEARAAETPQPDDPAAVVIRRVSQETQGVLA